MSETVKLQDIEDLVQGNDTSRNMYDSAMAALKSGHVSLPVYMIASGTLVALSIYNDGTIYHARVESTELERLEDPFLRQACVRIASANSVAAGSRYYADGSVDSKADLLSYIANVSAARQQFDMAVQRARQ